MARRGNAQGSGARDLNGRVAALALALALAACATARVKVLQPLPEPVRRVSVAFDPVDGVPQAELDGLAEAVASALVRDGVTVVPRGQGAPELVGHATSYAPELRLVAVWLLLGGDGTTLGQCRTEYGVALGLDPVDWGDVIQHTGSALALFLAGP